MSKSIRRYIATAFFLTAIAIPIATTFGDLNIDDAIRRAKVAICQDTFNSCTTQCSNTASAAPGSYQFCMQDCSRNYQRCMNQISRGAAATGATGVTSHPSVAPPTPTPRKISPVGVTGTPPVRLGPKTSAASPKPTVKPGTGGSFRQLPPDQQREVARDTVKTMSTQHPAKTSPTATPRKN